MLVGLGVDLMDVARMDARTREDAGLLEQLFTPDEITYCTGKRYPAAHYAARFAAKEAFFKALGIDGASGRPWREVEICNQASGKPELRLHAATEQSARARNVKTIHVSLSHTRETAIAQVILES
jgi:holo-[acyl-carrier protein] synthase